MSSKTTNYAIAAKLIADGYSDEQAAEHFGCTVQTIKYHKKIGYF